MTSSERARRERLHGPQPADGPPPKNSPAPEAAKPANPYARFIPREELGNFASWKPGDLTGGAVPPFERRAANGDRRSRGTATGAGPAPKPPPPPPEVRTLQQQHAIALKAARQAGYQDGYRDGLVALDNFKQTFAQQITAQVAQLFEAAGQQLEALQGDIAQAVAESAVRLAREVVRQELQQRPEIVQTVAEDAVQALAASARQLCLRVHPDDHALLVQGASDTLQRRGVQLQPDASVSRGGCLLQADIGRVDASVEARWAAAAANLGHAQVAWDGGVRDLVDQSDGAA
jgi:flagellar assembly protein FliH